MIVENCVVTRIATLSGNLEFDNLVKNLEFEKFWKNLEFFRILTCLVEKFQFDTKNLLCRYKILSSRKILFKNTF